MDWFSWLEKTTLEPSLIYEYGLAFSHNELQEEDIPYFNHEFLQSMGISIAKHRLEILKLARKQQKTTFIGPNSVTRVLIAIKKTKRCLTKCVREWIQRHECKTSSALVVVPRPSNYRSRSWRGAMLKRNKKLVMKSGGDSNNKQERLLLTNGSFNSMVVSSGPRVHSFSSPKVIYDFNKEEEKIVGDDDHRGGYLQSGVEDQIRWDTMFQNLKPT